MRLCIVEDGGVDKLDPLTLTRPVFDLRFGSGKLGSRLARTFGLAGGRGLFGAIVRPHLVDLWRQREPHLVLNDREWLSRGPVLVVDGRWVPPAGFRPPEASRPLVGLCEGRPACVWAGPGQAVALEIHGVDDWFEKMSSSVDRLEVGGRWIEWPWDLVSGNAEALCCDFRADRPNGVGHGILQRAAVVGPLDRLFVHESARVDPYTVFDTMNGPITVEAGVWVQPFTRIEGPCFVGRDTQLFRANLRGGVTLGPSCRVGGEVEASIVQGHSNKYHEGFLGHAYVGEWVNLGAITSNSDLRNDYGEVYVPLRGDPIATARNKVGCFVGDHTRTGLGSMLNTGTAIGVMCDVLPAGRLLPKHVPSFVRVAYGRITPGPPLEQKFATARTVKHRRGLEFTEQEELIYAGLFEATRLERERAIRRAGDGSRGELPQRDLPQRAVGE